MNLRRIRHTLKRMSVEEKTIGLGAITMLVGSFMPWHAITLSIQEGQTISNAYTGDIGVIGFVVALMSLLSILYLIAENLHIRLPQFGYKKSQILFFLMGQSFFLVLLTLAIYLRRSIEYVDAGLRFGVYISLAGTFLAAFAAFAKVQKVKEKQTKEFFHQENEEKHHQNHEEEEGNQVEPMYFGEDKDGPVISPAFQASDPLTHNSSQRLDNLPKDDTMDEVEIVEKRQEAPHSSSGQASFFSKEAGLK